MECTILGAGQDVGRSCIILQFQSARLMLDCGAHCGFIDHRRYPALQLLGNVEEFDNHLELLTAKPPITNSDEGSGFEDVSLDKDLDPFAADQAFQNGNKAAKSREYMFQADCRKRALKQVLNNVTCTLDCAIISHFHLDHVGALPFLTEHLGYRGPIAMTYPTKGLSPILLRDGAQVTANRNKSQNAAATSTSMNALLNRKTRSRGQDVSDASSANAKNTDPWAFTTEHVAQCFSKPIPMQLKASHNIGKIKATPYYAGHVLGAAVYHVECDGYRVAYTGDFNTVPDKHLGPAKVPRLRPDVLICESTYATAVRQPRRATEMELCTSVHDCLLAGGKVLIPVFAVGRAQELAIILNDYWTKLQLQFPIYFGGGLSERATNYYKLHCAWTHSENMPNYGENVFALQHMQPFDNSLLNDSRPMVLFATPGMVHAGLALRACKQWATNPNNLIVIPGYSVQGTVGNKLISGEKQIQSPIGMINVKCKVRYLSFSAHADSAGIVKIIRQIQPQNLILVHGEHEGMKRFARQIQDQYGIRVYTPANGDTVRITQKTKTRSGDTVYANVDAQLMLQVCQLQCEFNRLMFGTQQDSKGSAVALIAGNTSGNNGHPPPGIAILARDALAQAPRRKWSVHLNPQPLVHQITLRKRVPCTSMKYMQVTNSIAQFVKANKEAFKQYKFSKAQVKDTLTFQIGALKLEHVRGSNFAIASCTFTSTSDGQTRLDFEPGCLEYATMQLLKHPDVDKD